MSVWIVSCAHATEIDESLGQLTKFHFCFRLNSSAQKKKYVVYRQHEKPRLSNYSWHEAFELLAVERFRGCKKMPRNIWSAIPLSARQCLAETKSAKCQRPELDQIAQSGMCDGAM